MSKNIKKFRIINKIEKNIITNSISKISHKALLTLENIKSSLFISFNPISIEDNFPSIYLIPNGLAKTLVNVEQETKVCSAGVYFGFIKIDQFYLSLEGAEFLNKLNAFPEKHHIVVKNEGEKSILYGNHIIKKFLYKTPNFLEKNTFLLIFNESNELISIGYSQVDYDSIYNLRPKDIIAKNLIDKGYYLRKEQ